MNSNTPTMSLEGVQVKPLKKLVNDRGFLMEVQRNDESDFPGFGQAYLTSTLPGIVKAWYRHHVQYDQIAIAQGQLLMVLYDTRPESSTVGQLQEIRLTDESPSLVVIPPGVWHGFTPIGTIPALLLHLNTEPINLAQPDEERIPFDDASIPFSWNV